MLKLLKIKNIALIENITIEFENGLNVLTGETGAGKSIIIDSLNFVLGARSDKTLIRSGENTARVDALFSNISSNQQVKNFFISNGLEIEDEILISRTMSLEGKTDIRVNGNPITASMLRELASNLVDIYGQQEQVSLLSVSKQLNLLDNFAKSELSLIKLEYQTNLKKLKEINKELNKFGGDGDSSIREKDYLSFVINEIEAQDLSVEEEEKLKSKIQVFSNMEKILSASNSCQNFTYSSLQYLSNATSSLGNITKYDEYLEKLYVRLKSTKLELEDINNTLMDYVSNLEFSENEYNKLVSRLDIYKTLEKKYGGSVEKTLNYLEECRNKLNILVNSEQVIAELQRTKSNLLNTLFIQAKKINEIRQKYAIAFQERLKENLKFLGMQNANIFFEFSNIELKEENLTTNGIGQVEIMFSANLGQEEKSLNKVASGGELSRVMLAIKSIISEKDDFTMVFDEIDTGISGQIAQAVSEKIAQISKYHQVLVITHTIQIASMADAHFKITKQEQNNNTVSCVQKLDFNGIVEEISRFITSIKDSKLARESAVELLESQQKIKHKII